MKTKTIKLYEYSELSDRAKEYALRKWNETNNDPFMQSHMINLLKEELDERDIKYDADSIDVRYSLGYCQGDGFMFIGTVMWRDVEVTITHDDPHYYHKNTARFSYDEESAGARFVELFDQFKVVYEDICRKMERVGYDYIEWVQSEENFIEMCEANEWTFRENGVMENA